MTKVFKGFEGALENRWHLRARCYRFRLSHHFAFVLKLELGNDSCLCGLIEDDAGSFRFLSEVADSYNECRKKQKEADLDQLTGPEKVRACRLFAAAGILTSATGAVS